MDKVLGRVAAACIAIYFLYFAIPAIHAGFAIDDPMNMGFYWMRGFWPSAGDILRFWSTAYRPMGALFYLPIYHFAGVNPVPYRILALSLIGGNIFLTWRLAMLLSDSRATAALAAMLVVAHASMVAIYYNTSMLYDIMAYFFVALMLCLYISFRRRGAGLSVWQSAAVAACFVAALDSKELAVVASVWVLAYELLFHRPRKLLVPILLCAISAVYTLGKFLGPNPLAKQDGYRLEMTPHRYLVNHRIYLNDLFYTDLFSTSRRVVFLWLALAAICWIVRKRELWWSWFVISTATLGVAFTVVSRGQSGIYLWLLGWSILVSILATGFLKKRVALQWGVVGILALLLVPKTVLSWGPQTQAYLDDHRLTTAVCRQVLGVSPRPAPHERVLFLKNPFEGYDAEFIGMLVWNDHTLEIQLADHQPDPRNPEDYQWVMTFEGENLRVLKRPR